MTRRSPGRASMSKAWNRCRYRTLIGTPGAPVEAAFAAIGGSPAPIDPDRLAEMVAIVLAGKRVLIMGDTPLLRDRAKAELVGMLQKPAGRA